MKIDTDLTFITNEPNKKLIDRFKVLIKDTRFFDVLVGYFFTSGFYSLYKSLENTEKIRVLIGISTNVGVAELLEKHRQEEFQFSHAEAKKKFSEKVVEELAKSEDNMDTEEGIKKFIEWIKSKKLEIRAFPSENIHSKLYIMTFREGDRDVGRVITGSSNFSFSGLSDNLEFNVELKNPADYKFAKEKFDELWKDSVDVSDKYVETVKKNTWLSTTINPYELYLKFLYEYFKDELSQADEVFYKYVPEEFIKLEYQEQAVLNAKKILDGYGGVFLSDVVGSGKTYIAAMLANQIDGRHLVLAPPILLNKDNPGSWPSIFSDFRVPADFESIGKLDAVIKRGTDKYKNIFIDEAHRFRTESTITYEKLAQITRGKRVVLVTATPLNNTPKDILSQIKLFQKPKNSTIPNVRNLELFFGSLQKRLKELDRQKDYDEYMRVVAENANEIREKVLKYLMVRRTRNEIIKYFGDDLKKQKLKFPEVKDPQAEFYELNEEEDTIFTKTLELIIQKFTYARYTPLLYYEGKIDQLEKQSQRNLGRFMKILLVKRLESSFYAFKKTLERFIQSYNNFIREFDKGNVFVSKKHSNKIFEMLENDDDEGIQRLIDEDKARKFNAKDFNDKFREDLQNDLEVLKEINSLWSRIKRDPKLIKFLDILSTRKVLRENKLIIFSESKETIDYLEKNISSKFPKEVLAFSGSSSAATRKKVIENFDARARFPKDDFRILVSTEVLAEGVNLHRSNVVINYDIPWNPTRLMQRVGRINRVDTKFDNIFTFNFFPTQQSNVQIKLKEAAEAKIQAFIEMLGVDARLLTEGEEIKSHDLFEKLLSKKAITGEDEKEESDLKYLHAIRDIRDKKPDLFEKIKRLPKKARTARQNKENVNSLLTYFRKGKLQKFYLSNIKQAKELDFLSSATLLEVKPNTPRKTVSKDYFRLLDRNKEAFREATTEEIQNLKTKGAADSSTRLFKILYAKEIREYKGFIDEDELYYKNLLKELQEGGLPKQTVKRVLKNINSLEKKEITPLKILAVLKTSIPYEFFKETIADTSAQIFGPREVILSEYFVG